MKRPLLFLLVVLSWSTLTASSQTQPAGERNDRTLSPYFFIEGGDASVDRLPLKSTSAVVDITGVIARVWVTQVYRNEGKRTLEAVYVFPGSTRAAVHGMTMKVGDRVITAEDRGAAGGAPAVSGRAGGRSDGVAARATAPERLPDERGQHPPW